jgi:hypothetical protein
MPTILRCILGPVVITWISCPADPTKTVTLREGYKNCSDEQQAFHFLRVPQSYAMSARYRRVNQGEVDEEDENKKASAERAERISAKIHALFWVLAAITIVYFTDLGPLLFSDKLNRLVFTNEVSRYMFNQVDSTSVTTSDGH